MNKSDLKSGMVVKTRNKELFLVVGDLLISETGFMTLTSFDINLKNKLVHTYDIMEIYKSTTQWGNGFSKGLYYRSKDNPIWKREEIREVTLQEIAEKFDIPVENLRIKE